MNKKRDYAMIVSLLSAATALICVGIVVFHNFDQNGVVELGTFLGVGVALIGICATLIVGLQILNYIEFKEVKVKINDIDLLKKDIEDKERIINNIHDKSTEQLASVFFILASKEEEIDIKITLFIQVIVLTSQMKNIDDIDAKAIHDILQYILERLDILIERNELTEPVMWDEFKAIKFNKTIAYFDEIESSHREVVVKIDKALKVKNQQCDE